MLLLETQVQPNSPLPPQPPIPLFKNFFGEGSWGGQTHGEMMMIRQTGQTGFVCLFFNTTAYNPFLFHRKEQN